MAKLQVNEITTETAADWDAFTNASPQGSLFSSWLWKGVVERGTPFSMRIYGVCLNNRLAAGVVLMEKRQIGHLVALNPLLTPYQGFLLPPPSSSKLSDRLSREHRALTVLIKFLERRYAQIDLYNVPALTDVRPFLQHRWRAVPRFTYYLNIADLDALWEGFDGSVRRAIKKAQRSELTVGKMQCTPGEIFNLLEQTFQKQGGKNPIPETLIDVIVADEKLSEHRVCIGARTPGGELISAIVCLWDERRAYYLLAASNPAFLSTGVNSLLIWELARYLSNTGIHSLDFIGANIPGIARFKETLNPETITYYRLERWTSPIFRISKKAGQFILRH